MASNAKDLTTLRKVFREADQHKAQEIRDAYYKVVEGLQTLTEAILDVNDALDLPCHPLLAERMLAREALKAMSNSQLGKIL